MTFLFLMLVSFSLGIWLGYKLGYVNKSIDDYSKTFKEVKDERD